MLINAVRNGLGQIIILADKLTRPSPLSRTAEEQLRIEKELRNLQIYQYNACPFCIKTRRALHALNLPIELRDVKQPLFRQELESQGGKIQVPCLKIKEKEGKTRWLYESRDIINYLTALYG